jgi:hypothetical protein
MLFFRLYGRRVIGNDGLENALTETAAHYYKDISFKFPEATEEKH